MKMKSKVKNNFFYILVLHYSVKYGCLSPIYMSSVSLLLIMSQQIVETMEGVCMYVCGTYMETIGADEF